MATLDIFKSDAFSMMSLLSVIENIDHKPQFLGSLNLFESNPVTTKVVAVESRDDELALIQTSPRGAPPEELSADKRKVRNFDTVRVAKRSRIMADEVQGIRAFGSETEMQQAQDLVARRLMRLQDDTELTWENHRLGAVQGIVTDADGTTIVDFYSEFGVNQPSEESFDFTSLTEGQVRPKIEGDIVRPLIRNAKGSFLPTSRVFALVGDDFWDDFVNHAEVRETFKQQEGSALRQATAFGAFRFAGVEWFNYRGTDDNSTVAIGAKEAKFFPVDAPGVFEVAWAPGESFERVNRPGVPLLPLTLPDTSGRDAFVDVETYSYPLYICRKPLTLRRAAIP